MTTPPGPRHPPAPANPPAARPGSPAGHQDELAALQALAAALAERGCQADLVTPQPYLNVRPPGAETTHQLYADGQQFYWPVALPARHRAEISLAADTIVWALRAHPTKATR
jgi:hypothetical protein